MHKRVLNLPKLLKKRSYFLFGPRATGKSTLIKNSLENTKIYDLLHGPTYQRLLRNSQIIGEESDANTIIVIDEVQKLPQLLDEVHRLISNRNQKFLLTGSSARKLRRGSANLLAGRAFFAELFPLISLEVNNFDLMKLINSTGLPEFFGDDMADEFLLTYTGTYLKEEIQAESLTRNLPGFARFLETTALMNGEEVNYASVSSDTGVAKRTLENYYSILQDTLIGFSVPPFLKTKKRKAITRSKHWFFDIGVVNTLTKRGEVKMGSELFGRAFEHFIVLELRAWLSYKRIRAELYYFRSTSKVEVDFIIGNWMAIEVKATNQVQPRHLKGLRLFKEEGLVEKYCVVSLDPEYRITEDGIEIYPWRQWIEFLWAADEII